MDVAVEEKNPSRFTAVTGLLTRKVQQTKLPRLGTTSPVELPTDSCVEYATRFLSSLFREHSLIPDIVAASAVGGVYAVFRSTDNSVVLRIEIDNDLDVVGSLSVNRDVILWDDLTEDSIGRLIGEFRKRCA